MSPTAILESWWWPASQSSAYEDKPRWRTLQQCPLASFDHVWCQGEMDLMAQLSLKAGACETVRFLIWPRQIHFTYCGQCCWAGQGGKWDQSLPDGFKAKLRIFWLGLLTKSCAATLWKCKDLSVNVPLCMGKTDSQHFYQQEWSGLAISLMQHWEDKKWSCWCGSEVCNEFSSLRRRTWAATELQKVNSANTAKPEHLAWQFGIQGISTHYQSLDVIFLVKQWF